MKHKIIKLLNWILEKLDPEFLDINGLTKEMGERSGDQACISIMKYDGGKFKHWSLVTHSGGSCKSHDTIKQMKAYIKAL